MVTMVLLIPNLLVKLLQIIVNVFNAIGQFFSNIFNAITQPLLEFYNSLMPLLPDGKLFSLRAVFEATPGILQNLPITLLLTVGGAVFGILLAMVFAIVKINRVKVLYPIQAFFVSFLRGTPISVSYTHLTLPTSDLV